MEKVVSPNSSCAFTGCGSSRLTQPCLWAFCSVSLAGILCRASDPLKEVRTELNVPTRRFFHQAWSESLGAGSDLAGGQDDAKPPWAKETHSVPNVSSPSILVRKRFAETLR